MKAMMLATAATLALALPAPSQALELLSTIGNGPVGNCQPARPSYEGLIRKRPLAFENEGTSGAYVTCALSGEEVSINLQSFSTRVSNGASEDVTVTCTAVVGDELAAASYIPKSVTLAPGTAANITWTGADAGGLFTSHSVAISCLLPPGSALNRNRITTLLSLI